MTRIISLPAAMHALAAAFAPFETLASQLLPCLEDDAGDGAHDPSHLVRVWRTVCRLQQAEGGQPEVLLAATLLHDCVRVEKSSPLRAKASALSAQRAATHLAAMGWSAERIAAVAHAIEAHSFSAGVAPTTIEARLLQDADRLDAIGAIGVARCFYTAGRMQSALYDPVDPQGQQRALDDRRFALDHFAAKLFGLADGFNTATASALAQQRLQTMRAFVDDLMAEL